MNHSSKQELSASPGRSQVVFTALLGQTESLLEQKTSKKSGLRFICFTDNYELESDTWEIFPIEPLFPADPRRSQRAIKIRGHHALDEFEQWLYIDNTVRLKVNPEQILNEWLSNADWAAISHDANSTVWREFEANESLSKEREERLLEQLNDYSTFHAPVLDERPLWNGMFARRNTPEVRATSELWFDHVLRYSARDQLSALVALDAHPEVRLNRITSRLRESPWHDWPHRQNETAQSKAGRHARQTGLKNLSDELADARDEIARLRSELEEASAKYRRLADRRLFGTFGLWRLLSEARRRARIRRKQARKRR